MKLSAIVLTLNEEEFLPNCLESVSWADEVVVIDAGSTDKTLDIASQFNTNIVKAKWRGFPNQRNIAAKHAKGDWLLYVDADERVSRELRSEIEKILKDKSQPHSSYKIPHRNIILGKWLRHGGWYPEYQHRLIKKSAFKKWKGELHEHPEVEGSVGYLENDLIHLTHRGMKWMLDKTIRYTKMEAELRLQAGHPKVRAYHFFTSFFREFKLRAIKKQGWKDGIEGWIEIFYQSFNQFLIMAWLWELQNAQSMDDLYGKIDREMTDEL